MQEPDEEQVVVLLKGITIPPQPKIVLDLMDLFKRADPDSEKIVRLVSSDVALSAKMLKLVNSPLFRTSSAQVASVQMALMRVGFKNFYNLVLVSSLQGTFATKKEDQEMIDALWDHSLKIAKICELITTRNPGLKGTVSPDLAYMTGLFHDCSLPLMLGKFNQYRDVFYSVLDNTFSTEDEDDQFATSHALASYLMAKTWSLPKAVYQAILNHHATTYREDADSESAEIKLWAILAFAESLAPRTECKGFHRRDLINDEWTAACGTIIDELYLSEGRIERIVEGVDELLGVIISI
jgi:HD-like signal output (HDOD) protein